MSDIIIQNVTNFVNETTDFKPDQTNCFQPTSIELVSWLPARVFLILLYSLTSILALIGNVTVIVVELYGSESAQNIRRYLINLAVADIMFSVLTVPFTYTSFMLSQWIFPHWLCPTASYVQLLCVFVTSITLSVIGVERYMAVLHPFSNVHIWLESHTHLILISIWILGALYALIPLSNTHTREYVIDNVTLYECSYKNDLSTLKRQFFISSNFVFTFLLPLVVLICSYSSIMKQLLREQKQRFRQSQQEDQDVGKKIYQPPRHSFPVNHRSKTIKMMFTIMLLFAICWAPIKIYQTLMDYHLMFFCTKTQFYAFITAYFVCHWTAMASSFVNPIVYSFMSRSFRKDLDKISKKIKRNSFQASTKTILTQMELI